MVTYDIGGRLASAKTKTTKFIAISVLLIGSSGGLMLGLLGTAQAAPNFTVTQANPQGWAFADDNGHGGSGEFVNGPGTPPLGSGSAELDLTTADGTQGYLLGKSAWGGTKLSDITSLKYSTYVQQGNNTVAPALQLNVDDDLTNGTTSWQGRLVYEPYFTHTVTDGTWQTWNTQDNATNSGHGNWWFSNSSLATSTGCAQSSPCTWNQVLSALPNAGIDSGANQGIVFKAGSGWNVQFKGNVDAFTIGVSGSDTTYNFDYQNCHSVTTSRGSLTAAQVGGNVTGNLDAYGCDIGVYYDHSHQGQVKNASIHDANGYGVFVDGFTGNVSVSVSDSHVYNIGNHVNGVYTPNGVQTGVDVYYNSLVLATGQPTSGKVQGGVSDSRIDNYQKGGVVLNGTKTNVDTDGNVVTGAGPVDYIAQNGIQVSRGANGDVTNNTVAANAYTGINEATSAGVLIYGGWGDPLATNITVQGNKLIDNDVGVNFANYNSDASGPATSPTRNVVKDNWIFSSAVTNTTGLVTANYPAGIGYQAGIEDVDDRDFACNNTILGPGYINQGSFDGTTDTATPGPDNAVVRYVDAGYTFPTTDFSTCHGHGYGGGHFNQNFFKHYHDYKFNRWYWFSR